MASETKQVKAWAVIDRKGNIRGKWQPLLSYEKEGADRNKFMDSERVVPVVITYNVER
jgi:hypothetical protein